MMHPKVYQLNADDLDEDFLEELKTTSKHKEIEIVVHERNDQIAAGC